MSSDRGALVALTMLGITLGTIGGMGAAAMHRRAGSRAPEAFVAHVPHAKDAPVIDGELEDPAWVDAARTGGFTSEGAPARPYSDARFSWRDGMLYVVLYAADEDIRFAATRHDEPLWGEDAFELVFSAADGSERTIFVSAGGIVTDTLRRSRAATADARWESGARVAVDRDGTPNDPSDDDEEWVVEMAIPLAALGLAPDESPRVSVRRCDVLRGHGDAPPVRVCARFPERGSATLVLASPSP